jgi:hypothetical protein
MVIIQTIKCALFKPTGEGVKLPDYFEGGMPLPTIALAATAIHTVHDLYCCLPHPIIGLFPYR